VALIFSISIAQSRNLATLQRDATITQQNNHATLHATEQSRNLATQQSHNATITQPCNATITQPCKNQNCNVVVDLLDLEKKN
jgi:hypothetical protein